MSKMKSLTQKGRTKTKQLLSQLKNDGTDIRKNDPWRILLFALNQAGGAAITLMMGRVAFYTQNVMLLGAFFIGAIVPVRICFVFLEPIVANMIDNFNSKYGKLRPFMLFGCCLSLVPALVIFFYPIGANVEEIATYVILIACYALAQIGNIFLMGATRAGQAIITQDPKQRPIYALGETVFEGILMGYMSLAIDSNIIGSKYEPLTYRVSIIFLGVLSFILVGIAMKAISTRDTQEYYDMGRKSGKIKERTKFSEFFKLIRRNKPLQKVLFATVSDAIAANVRGGLTVYLFANILMNDGLQGTFDIVSGLVVGAPFIAIGVYLASKKGTAKVYTKISLLQMTVSLLGAACALVFFWPNPDAVFGGITLQLLLVLACFSVYISTLGVSSNLTNALAGDLADYEYTQTKKFIPGTVSSTISFCNGLAASLCGFLTLGIMMLSGFHGTGSDAAVPQNQFVNNIFYFSILISVFILPFFGHLITYIAMRKYPLSKDIMEVISRDVAIARGIYVKTESDLHFEELTKNTAVVLSNEPRFVNFGVMNEMFKDREEHSGDSEVSE